MINFRKVLALLAFMGAMPGIHAQLMYLHSDNPQINWKLKPQAEISMDAAALCESKYNASAWVDAVVPGTAFNSYVVPEN